MLTGNAGKDFDTLVNRLVRLVDVLINLLSVYVNQCIVHPALMPSQPVTRRYPQLTEWLKVLRQLGHLVKLHIKHS